MLNPVTGFFLGLLIGFLALHLEMWRLFLERGYTLPHWIRHTWGPWSAQIPETWVRFKTGTLFNKIRQERVCKTCHIMGKRYVD